MSQYTRLKFYYPEVTYKYVYEGKEYESSSVSNNLENIWVPEVDEWGTPTPEDKKFWSKWVPGTEIEVLINPRKPSEAVIYKKLSRKYRSHNYALIVGGLLLVAAWMAIRYMTQLHT